MKSALHACSVGLLAAIFTLTSAGKLTRPGVGLIGKFYTSGVKGDVTIVTEGRILTLKKGDSFLARGDTIETAGGATATIVYSNGTAVFIDENTRFIIEKFDQEFFAPNNNLRVEPSNSSTVVKLVHGRVVISTPRLLSGTTMYYQTPHAAVSIRGEKVLIETNEKQTHVAMISGNATVNPRDADGNFVSLGKRLVTGQEAYVKFTIAAKTSEADEAIKTTAAADTGNAAKPGSLAIGAQLAPEASIAPVTSDGEAVVVRLTGPAKAKLPKATSEIALAEGTKLPPGTFIETGKDAELYLQPMTGVIADLRANTVVHLEHLSVTMAGDVVKRQSALLDLKAGTIVSTIDPALHSINDYGVRTPKGIAKAGGTSFTASVSEDGYSVATTADTVSFITPSGTAYTVNAGQVTITPAGGDPQPPISLTDAIAANPSFATDIRGALTAVTTVIQSNLGNLSPDSALDLVSKVAGTVAAALPEQAAEVSTQVVAAVSAPSAATSSNVGAAAQAVTSAITAAAPDQASQVAAAAVGAAPGLAVSIATGAAKGAPASAVQIASTVAQAVLQSNPGTDVTPANVQLAAAIGAGITSSAPDQAAPVAAAIMQAVSQVNPQASAEANAQNAANIASAVTNAAPNQAVPVAATMMKVLAQTPALTDATPEVITQSAATLASGITSVVPPQEQQVATAVMQLVSSTFPNVDPSAVSQIGDLVAQNTAANSSGNNSSGGNGGTGAGGTGTSGTSTGGGSTGDTGTGGTETASTGTSGGDSGTGGGTGSTGTNANSTQPGSTSIFITQFDPGQVGDAMSDLQAAQTAQTNVQFDTQPGPSGGGGGDTVVVPVETTPSKPPPDFVVSPANG